MEIIWETGTGKWSNLSKGSTALLFITKLWITGENNVLVGRTGSKIQKQWSGTNPTGTRFISFPSPSLRFFPFLLSFSILMSSTAFYRGTVPVWYITGRTHTGERGQDSSRVTAMLAERLRVLRQACWFKSVGKKKSTIMLREMAEAPIISPRNENAIRTSYCRTFYKYKGWAWIKTNNRHIEHWDLNGLFKSKNND